MGQSDVNLSRQEFLKLSGLAILGSSLELTSCDSNRISGQILGLNHQIGHLVRKAIQLPISRSDSLDVAIIGSGISGLTAGYFLQKYGVTNYQLFELEQNVGGNAAFGQDEYGHYPWAAHYLPIPSADNKILIDFLVEHSLIRGFDQNQKPIYDEYALCAAPEERLFIKGYWQDGLIPKVGVSADAQEEIERFLKLMQQFKQAKGNDYRWAFAIPSAESSADPLYTCLDQISMSQWLQQQDFGAKELLWYVNYCLLDDYGTPINECSAWAGIHYFAARRGEAANADSDDVLTWPEGNGFLMQLLVKNQHQNLKTGHLVYQVQVQPQKVHLDIYDWEHQQRVRVEAKQVIWAIPQFLRPYLLPQFETGFIETFDYAPWLVANILTQPFDTGKGQRLSWDNVLYDGLGLGYIVANHQNLNRHQAYFQLTYYKPITGQQSAILRKEMLRKTYDDWVKEILVDFNQAHPNFEKYVQKIDIKVLGHAMIKPTVGFRTSDALRSAQKAIENRIHFAHSDLSGLSLFEEAFSRGWNAAKTVINELQSSGQSPAKP